jgi:LAO/AO transport system kinase
MLRLGERPDRAAGGWVPPVVKTVASAAGGVAELVAALDAHQEWLESSGQLAGRRRSRAAGEIEAIALAVLRDRMDRLDDGIAVAELAGRVVAGEVDPYAAADELVVRAASAPVPGGR